MLWSNGLSDDLKGHLKLCADCSNEAHIYVQIFKRFKDDQTPLPSRSLKPSRQVIRRATQMNRVRKTIWTTSLIAGVVVVLSAGTVFYLQSGHDKLVPGASPQKPVKGVQKQIILPKPTTSATLPLPDPQEAISRVLQIRGNEFPAKPGKIDGTITWATPGSSKTIPAQLETEITQTDNNTYVISLTETWKYADFHHNVFTKSQNTILTHSWKYKVTASDTTLLEDKGDYPPQYTN